MKEKITVRQTNDDPDQFIVENNHQELEGDFLEQYVSFSGFFGKHGPYVFAAGPELYAALENLLKVSEGEGGTKYHAGDIARAALAKARGGSDDNKS